MVIPVLDAHQFFHGAMRLSAGASTGIERGKTENLNPRPTISTPEQGITAPNGRGEFSIFLNG